MFVLDKVEYSLTTAPLAVAVAANTLLLALDAHRAIRVDLAQSQSVEEIELPRRTSTSDRVRYLYLDPTGRHAIFSLTNGDNYYLHARWRKAKLLSKLRGHCISSVAWAPGRSHPHSSTRPILLGTTQGRVIEAELEPADEYFRREERYIRPVHVHPEGEPITGLHILPLPGSRTQRAVILLTTKKQLYQFIGPTGQASHGSETYTPSFDTPLYGPVFQNQSNRGSAPLSPGGGRGPNVLEVPTGGKISSLALHTPAQTMMPDRMAWLVDSGSYHGRINLDPNSSSLESKNQGDSILEEGILLPFPSSLPSSTSPPMDILLTAFHFVLLLPRRILAISRLTDRVVFDVAPPGPTETFRSLTQDTAKGTFWAITDKALYELIVTGEDRDVWDTFLSKRDYTSALRYARTEGQRERVRDAQATHFLEQGLLHEAADLWARTHRSLEEVALLLMDHALTNEDGTDPTGQASSFSGEERGQAPLRHFLTQRLDSGMIEGGTGGRKMQATMVATWLVELHLSRLDRLDDLYGRTGGKARIEDASGEEEQSLAHQEFCLWIDQHKTLLDAPTTYSLMESHARWPEYLHYAGAIGDWDRVIRYYLEDRDASKALMTLSRHGTEESVYRFSGHLMEMSPRGTVDMWIQRGKELVPRRLLPILMEYELHRGPGGMPRGETTHLDQGNEEDQALRYLEFSTGRLGCRDPVVHNYLLHLLARDAGPQEEHLLAYLRRQEEQGGGAMQSREDSPGVTSVPFHVDYALRECQRHGRAQACVRLYGLKGMWEDAVDLALKEKDLELARIYADRPASLSSSSNLLDGGTEEQELRRSLWLKIARYVVEEEKDVARAMQYLQHCPLLKIEDILPLFPDFVLINDFKVSWIGIGDDEQGCTYNSFPLLGAG